MELTIFDIMRQSGLTGGLILVSTVCLLCLMTMFQKVHILMFCMVLSAAFVGASDPVLGALAPIVRWTVIPFILAFGIFFKRLRLSVSALFFLAYILFGIFFLCQAIVIEWQLQRALLLLIVFFGICAAYSDADIASAERSLHAIALAGAVFCCVNLFPLFDSGGNTRFSGYLSKSPAFSVVVAGFLPFMMFAGITARRWTGRMLFFAGTWIGAVILTFTGQRTGTIAGIAGLLPFAFLGRFYRTAWKWLIILVSMCGIFVMGKVVSSERFDLLQHRYGDLLNLSNRDLAWAESLREILKSPIMGFGIGAAEQVVESSFHQTYLEVWFNAGLPGLICFVAALVCCGSQIINMWRRKINHDESEPFNALCTGYFISFLIMSFFESLGAAASNTGVILLLLIMMLVYSK
jgi:O-antigen ligase